MLSKLRLTVITEVIIYCWWLSTRCCGFLLSDNEGLW